MSLGVQGEFFRATGAEDQEPAPEGEAAPEEGVEDTGPDHLQLLKNLYDNHAENGSFELREKVVETLRPGNYEFLMKALAFMVNSDLVFDG